tara:strand:- start:605 stop:985 length:381 start_codon:yes stop_codon:yes gene_type:complete
MINLRILFFLCFLFWIPVSQASNCHNYPYRNGVQRLLSDDGKSILLSTYTINYQGFKTNIDIAAMEDYASTKALEQLYDYVNIKNEKAAIVRFRGLLKIATCVEPGMMQKSTMMYKLEDNHGIREE